MSIPGAKSVRIHILVLAALLGGIGGSNAKAATTVITNVIPDVAQTSVSIYGQNFCTLPAPQVYLFIPPNVGAAQLLPVTSFSAGLIVASVPAGIPAGVYLFFVNCSGVFTGFAAVFDPEPSGSGGVTGATGVTGVAGSTGAMGATGATGAAGTNGINGAVGATGATGPAGNLALAGLACPEGKALLGFDAGGSLVCGFQRTPLSFNGVRTNVAVIDVTTGGFTECYRDLYNNDGTSSLASIQAACSQRVLMLACRPTGSATLTVAAMALRTAVLTNTGDATDVTTNSNGVEWYYSEDWSWGFAPGGDLVNRTICDSIHNVDSDKRLCWRTGNHTLLKGNRCGLNDGISGSAAFERIIYQRTGDLP